MNGTMTRRVFTVLLGAFGASAIAGPSRAAKHYSNGRFTFSFRCFCARRQDTMVLGFWVRALDKANLAGDVPVILRLASDKALKNVVWESSVLATHGKSHIVRTQAVLKDGQIAPHAPVYCSLSLDNLRPTVVRMGAPVRRATRPRRVIGLRPA
jgi:hypothetical protein